MGAQRILQTVACVAATVATLGAAIGAPSPGAQPALGDAKPARDKLHERVAVIDLGPLDTPPASIRRRLAAAIVAARLDPVVGDGVEDALAGVSVDRDSALLESAMAVAGRAFGELDCAAATTAATTATTLAAARIAAGLASPERAKAWSYLLLCADRNGQIDAAMLAATRLRAIGSSDVPRDVLDRYPDVDTLAGRDLVEVEITSDAPGAQVWIDDRPSGPAPVHAMLSAGSHIIAATSGSRRGATHVVIAPGAKPHAITVATPDMKGTWADLAARIASWGGRVPKPAELGWVLTRVRARIAIIRYGETLEIWGQAGRATPPYRLGGEDGVATVAETDRAMALIVDRVHAWNDRAPDPDQPLLLDTGPTRREQRDEPTRWWVYASIAGAIATGLVILYVHDSATNTQHIVLDHPRSR